MKEGCVKVQFRLGRRPRSPHISLGSCSGVNVLDFDIPATRWQQNRVTGVLLLLGKACLCEIIYCRCLFKVRYSLLDGIQTYPPGWEILYSDWLPERSVCLCGRWGERRALGSSCGVEKEVRTKHFAVGQCPMCVFCPVIICMWCVCVLIKAQVQLQYIVWLWFKLSFTIWPLNQIQWVLLSNSRPIDTLSFLRMPRLKCMWSIRKDAPPSWLCWNKKLE